MQPRIEIAARMPLHWSAGPPHQSARFSREILRILGGAHKVAVLIVMPPHPQWLRSVYGSAVL